MYPFIDQLKTQADAHTQAAEQTQVMIPPQKGDAAVLLAVKDLHKEPHVLLTRRSKRMKSHSGEVALPGGKWEPCDKSLKATALREAQEEVGLNPNHVMVVEAMAPRFTRQGTRVTPFVANVPSKVALTPCRYELESLFWLPLSVVLNDERVQTDIFNVQGKEYWAPVFHFNHYKIWGFTGRLLVDYANHFFSDSLNCKIKRIPATANIPEVNVSYKAQIK